jgi:hypothetical protein
MSDWLHALPVVWMALMVFGATYLVAAGIYFAVSRLAAGGRARSFKAVSPGMLPPLGIVFGLFVAFIAAQVWNDNERAEAAVNREASALRTAVVLSSDFAEAGERLRRLIRCTHQRNHHRGMAETGASERDAELYAAFPRAGAAADAQPDAGQ